MGLNKEINIDFSISKSNPNCGNGTTAILYHNGAELASLTVASNDSTGTNMVASANLAVGDHVDLARDAGRAALSVRRGNNRSNLPRPRRFISHETKNTQTVSTRHQISINPAYTLNSGTILS